MPNTPYEPRRPFTLNRGWLIVLAVPVVAVVVALSFKACGPDSLFNPSRDTTQVPP